MVGRTSSCMLLFAVFPLVVAANVPANCVEFCNLQATACPANTFTPDCQTACAGFTQDNSPGVVKAGASFQCYAYWLNQAATVNLSYCMDATTFGGACAAFPPYGGTIFLTPALIMDSDPNDFLSCTPSGTGLLFFILLLLLLFLCFLDLCPYFCIYYC